MRLLRGHEDEVLDLAYVPDGSALASTADDDTVRVWDLGTGSERCVLRGDGSLGGCVAVSPDGSLLATGGRQRVVLWNALLGRRLAALFEEQWTTGVAHGGDVNAVSFSSDGRRIATAGDDSLVKVWDLESGRRRASLNGHRGEVLATVWSVRGNLLASGGHDGVVKTWDADTNRLRTNQKLGGTVWSLAVSPDGRTLAAASGPGVHVFELLSGAEVAVFATPGAGATCVAFAPDGRTLAAGCDDGSVRFFDVASERQTAAFGWGLGRMNSVRFAPDGMTVAAGGSSPDLVIWDV